MISGEVAETASEEQRAHMAQRLSDYLEDLQLHLQMVHRMYHAHMLPEEAYLREVAGTTAELDAIDNALRTVTRRRQT
jgi:hypothetical protein